jgi:type IV fimbrial biogenesis protein FimT
MTAHRQRIFHGCLGLTLIELMVTIAVAAILAAMAAPSFTSLLGSYRADAAAQELKASLDLARSEAIKIARTATACPSANGTSCSANSTNWASGWLIWSDADGTNVMSASEIIQVMGAVNSSLTFTGTASSVTFQSLGQISGTAPNFTISHAASSTTRYVCLSASGSSKVQSNSC